MYKKLLLLVLLIMVCSTAFAQVPRTISYQGAIKQSAKPIEGNHQLTINLYSSTGAKLYSQTDDVTITDGIFSVVLGSLTPIPPSMTFSEPYWLGIEVDASGELTPRTQFTATPYALNAATADIAKGVAPNATGVVTSLNETAGAIRIMGDSTVGITQNGQTITLHAFATGPGGSGGIQALQTPEKTLDIKFPSGPLSSLDVRDSGITTKKLVNGAVTMSKLNQGGATQGQVLRWNGTAWTPSDENGGSGSGWNTDGNLNTFAGADFVGTIDSQAFDLRSKNIIMLRLNPTNSIQRDAGGNTRGVRAIDLQTMRSAVTQVASGNASVISGGEYNTSSGQNSTVAGGVTNTASNSYSSVGGGGNNSATNTFATVAGGGHNTASNTYSVVGGGQNNSASGSASTVAGGVGDSATAYGSTISGGTDNKATGTGSTIAGGAGNFVNEYYSVVSGGTLNKADGQMSSVAGGLNNVIKGDGSAISGGAYNAIEGDISSIAGGGFFRLKGTGSFGFHNGSGSTDSAFITADSIAYFGNTNFWLGNTINKPSELRFYEAQNGGVTFPGGNTNYTAFKAGAQTANITYTLPTATPGAGTFLTSSAAGSLSWSSGLSYDVANGRLGANTTAPNTTVDAAGDFAMREHSQTVNNGINSNLAIGAFSFITLTGPNAAFSITGIAGGVNGKMVVLFNNTGQAMTLTNNDVLSSPLNRIFTTNAAGYTTPGGVQFDVVTLIYSPTKGGWVMVSHN